MAEETNIKEVVEEIKNANEDELKKVIEGWFESTRTAGMKIGAQFISAAIFGVIEKHIKKNSNYFAISSLTLDALPTLPLR